MKLWKLSKKQCLRYGERHEYSSASSAVVYFAPRRPAGPKEESTSTTSAATSNNLTPLHLREIASLLEPDFRYLAPCLGAALAASPFCGNLMRLGDASYMCQTTIPEDPQSLIQVLQDSSHLANLLFFQLIRESPMHVARNKSLPAAYLTPSLCGTLLGQSLLSTTNSWNPAQALKAHHGIKSNYIHQNLWTGVSLTRWKDLCIPLPPVHSQPALPLLASSLWLTVLWEVSHGKQDLWEFLLALDRQLVHANHRGILSSTNPLVEAMREDPLALEEWSSQTWNVQEDLSQDSMHAAMDRLLWTQHQENQMTKADDEAFAIALEKVCAGIALDQLPIHAKSPCPNGYYAYVEGTKNDGDDNSTVEVKADCAEVAVREIVDLLLWDDAKGEFDLDRLLTTASQRLVDLYHNVDQDSVDQDSGAKWFQTLSNLPVCDYLAVTPSGIPYELAPTISNIVRALQSLLEEGVDSSDRNNVWHRLEDLIQAWNAHQRRRSVQQGESNPLQLLGKEETLTHRSASTGNLLEHEWATLRYNNSLSGIELRMRCDFDVQSGMAAVTHLRERQLGWKSGVHQRLQESKNPALQALSLAIIEDETPAFSNGKTQEDAFQALLTLVSTPLGCDRRGLLREERETKETRDVVFEESIEAMYATMSTACRLVNHNAAVGRLLLIWLLSESPTVMEGGRRPSLSLPESLEEELLSLPISVLEDPALQMALETSWLPSGKALAAWARWKSSNFSTWQMLSTMSISDMEVFLRYVISCK